MGLLLVLIGLLLLLLTGWDILAIILICVGIALFIIPGAPYGYSTWRGERRVP
jgi:hypothetical protein